MRFGLATILLAMSLTGCTKCSSTPTCDVAAKYAAVAASGLAPSLGCKGTDAIAASFTAEMLKLNLCQNPPAAQAGPISALVCGPLASLVISLPGRVAPADWQCGNGGTVPDMAQAALTAACLTLPF